MKHRIAALVCAVGVTACLAISALAAAFYPVSVEPCTMGDSPGIKKIYQLSPSDDPGGIPTEDFEADGYRYHLTDMTQSRDVDMETRQETQSVTQDSSTADMAKILEQLPEQKEVQTEDGYSGTLRLEPSSVQVEVKGYGTSYRSISANRTYSDLSDADLSLVPKTVKDSGITMTLSNVQWSSDEWEDGSAHYTAHATYTGTAANRYPTGYTVTANYSGEVEKAGKETITYTAIFTGTKLEPEQSPEPETISEPEVSGSETAAEPEPVSEPERKTETGVIILGIAGILGCIVSLSMMAFCIIVRRKEKKEQDRKSRR